MSSDTMRGLNFGLAAGSKLTVTDAASVRSSALKVGERYLVTASAPLHVRLTTSTGDATVNDSLIGQYTMLEVEPWSTNLYIAAVAPSGGGGTLHISLRRSW